MIEKILKHWDFTNIEILEQLHKDSPRLIYKIMADGKLYILKGIPEEKNESVIIGNVSAHKYLGNEKRIAPRIFEMSNGDFFSFLFSLRFFQIRLKPARNVYN